MTESRASVTTCGSIRPWMLNAKGEDPCQIASLLIGNCTSNGVYNVPSILPGSSYPPPSRSEANICQCNTVAYSLMSACALCQNGSYQNFTSWVSNCPQAFVQYERYPNETSTNVDVPSYALLPLDSGQFNLLGATALGQAASDSLTISSLASTMTVSTLPTIATSTSATAASTSKSSSNFFIAITVGVSLTLLTVLVGGLSLCRHRRSHPYKPFFSRRNRPISLSISSIDSDSVHEAKVVDSRPPSTWDRVFSNFGLLPKTPLVSPYAPVKLSDNGLDSTLPSKQLSHSQRQVSTNPSMSQTVPNGSNQHRTTWARILSNFLPHKVTQFKVPYTRVELSDEGKDATAPNHTLHTPPSWRRPGPLDQQTPMLINSSITSNIQSSSNQPWSIVGRTQPNGQHRSRPKPIRIETLPVIQTISRVRPTRSSTIAEPSTTPRGDNSALRRVPQPVKNVPRPPGFTIEDTPTTTDGYPLWKRNGPPFRRDFFNPEMGASVTSLGTFNSFSTQRVEGEDPDSVLLIARPSEVFSLTPKTSDTRSLRSFSATSIDDSSKSMAGSSRSPFSPSISSMAYHDFLHYGNAESREKLFPASVRATGYTGVPLGKI